MGINWKTENSSKISESPPSLLRIKLATGDTYIASIEVLGALLGPRFTKELNPAELKEDIIYPWHQVMWIKEYK